VELQYRFIKKDGSVIWISDQKSFEFDADGTVAKVNGVIRDISRQKAIEIQLRDSEEYFRTMFESSPDGLVIFDLPLSRLEINRQFTHMFGYEQYEFSELPWHILERVPQNIIQARLDRLEREGHVEYNAIHFTKSGKVLYCNVKCSRLHTSKGPLYCAVVRDMTEKRSLEFQLQQYSQQLEKLVEQRTQQLTYYSERLENMVDERTAKLEAANKELEQFAYTISHDLRAPLICIEGFSNLLRDEVREKVEAEQADWIDIIISSTKRMNQLIADILELARIGRVVGQRVDVHLAELLDDIRQEFLLTFEKRRVTMTQDALFPPLVSDLQRLRQVFQNLISNAVKYNDKEEVHIDVHALEREQEVEIVISDNGMGIPADRREEIFGLFKRLHTDEEVEGTGAGLAIVKKIVESLGGRIWVAGEVGAGSEFHFTLPRHPAEEQEL
jgi:PAS domain S-box-containing protein